ncbi:MAG: tRNA pseudouridine(38-40) synthase TruA [Spirochaetales bacterium]|nr:tRNA pseudouridine(38-40) synthase TruA [Spirochaetales bacterium]
MSDRVIRLVVAYDGTDFCGWQRQAGQRTVQESLETALRTMHGHPVPVVGAGRTDSGVHAVGQVAHFATDIASIPANRFEPALNRLMPPDVRVVRSADADPGFHARFDARLRRYKYYLRAGPVQLPHLDRYAWRLFRTPDARRLNRLAACLHGEIDCATFAAAGDKSVSTFRYLHHAAFYQEGDALVFEIAANAFLYRMVRSIVGTLVELDAEGAPPEAMRDVLLARDRNRAGTTAPARGLFLWNVEYDVPQSPTPTGAAG